MIRINNPPINKEDFEKIKKRKTRVDVTYKLSKILEKRLHPNSGNPITGNTPPIKRIFIIKERNGSSEVYEKMIFSRLKTIQESVKRRMENRVLYFNELDSTSKEKLNNLQDIIIFDQKVAFKEYLLNLDDARAQESEIIINEKKDKKLLK